MDGTSPTSWESQTQMVGTSPPGGKSKKKGSKASGKAKKNVQVASTPVSDSSVAEECLKGTSSDV
jgi:hypothetical protein